MISMSQVDKDPKFLAALSEMRDAVLLTDEPVSVTMKNAVGDMPIHIFAVRGDVSGVQNCIDHGADINARGEHGFTPLHETAVQGHTALVAYLLSVGADPLARSDWDETDLEAVEKLPGEASQDLLEILVAATARRTSN